MILDHRIRLERCTNYVHTLCHLSHICTEVVCIFTDMYSVCTGYAILHRSRYHMSSQPLVFYCGLVEGLIIPNDSNSSKQSHALWSVYFKVPFSNFLKTLIIHLPTTLLTSAICTSSSTKTHRTARSVHMPRKDMPSPRVLMV